MSEWCGDFECVLMGKCINADNHCGDFQSCRLIHAEGKCRLCFYNDVCGRKEKESYGKNN